MMKEKPKRRRRREEKFACKKGEKPKKSEKERNTHTKIFPPCIISLLDQAR